MNWLSLGAGVAAGVVAEQLATAPLRRASSSEATPRPPCATDIEIPTPDGGVLRCVAAGKGTPVVLLHGITLRADVWHRQWELTDVARVIAVDLRGHGRSETGRDGASIEANARDLAVLLRALKLKGAIIVGHSMGGMVLGRFIADHLDPDGVEHDPKTAQRVAGVGFVSTAGRSPVGLGSGLLRRVAPSVRSLAARHPKLAARIRAIPDNDLGHILVRSTFGARPDVRDVRETADAFEAIEIDEFLDAAPTILDHDVLDSLHRCELPAEVIVGSRDPLTPVRESRRLARVLPNASLTVVDGAGHQLMLEAPSEVNAMIRLLVGRAAASRKRWWRSG